MVINKKGEAIYFSRSVIPYLRDVPQEDWLKRHSFYKHIGVYGYRTSVLEKITQLPQSPLEKAESLEQLRWIENGYRIQVAVTELETIGIDTTGGHAKSTGIFAEGEIKRHKKTPGW